MMSEGEALDKHHLFSQCKYIKTCMKTLEERLIASKGFSKGDSGFYNFLLKILTWEPEKRLKPHEALQDPWITKGLPT
jgi:serine/threonine protein kinase